MEQKLSKLLRSLRKTFLLCAAPGRFFLFLPFFLRARRSFPATLLSFIRRVSSLAFVLPSPLPPPVSLSECARAREKYEDSWTFTYETRVDIFLTITLVRFYSCSSRRHCCCCSAGSVFPSSLRQVPPYIFKKGGWTGRIHFGYTTFLMFRDMS